MANSRIYLRNKINDEKIFLGKSFGEGYYLRDYDDDWMQRYNEFLVRAYDCGLDGFIADSEKLNKVLEIVTE